MHVIKGMVGCLGDMETVIIKLHEEPNTQSVFLRRRQDVETLDGLKEACQSRGYLGNEAKIYQE